MKENSEKININEGSPREVFKIAFPLILSTSSMTLQMFVDRVFLMWYDRDAMSGAAMGGILNFVFFSLFMGTATYANTFVSQYDGAGMKNRIGPSVWQSVYFSIIAGVLMAILGFFSAPIISLIGHQPKIAAYELTYFRILNYGAIAGLLSSSLSCFLTGRGKTWAVMWVNFFQTLVNVVLDYAMIFGKWGFPQWGIAGAAIATVISGIASSIIFFILFITPEHRLEFGSSLFKFDSELFGRLMKFGIPSGLQITLDVFGFSLFVVFVGRIDPISLASTSMAFQINSLAFLPMIGFGIATSVLVGKAIGAGKPDIAQKTTWSASYITFAYMILIAIGYLAVPKLFMEPYAVKAPPEQFAAMVPIVKQLLMFVAFYCIFDTGNIIFSAALKGAGDTKFVMYISLVLNWIIMVIPSWLAVKYLHGSARLYVAWLSLSTYVCVLAVLFLLRFLAGKWKSMRVIEKSPVLPGIIPSVPTVEADMN